MPDGTDKLVREGPTPTEKVRPALDDEAFDPGRLALAAVKQGPLAALPRTPLRTMSWLSWQTWPLAPRRRRPTASS